MDTEHTNELIVFVIRETGWSLEYVRDLSITQLYAFAAELAYQKQMDEYHMATNFGMMIATWANAKGRRKFNVQDFVGNPPQRQRIDKEVDDIWTLAQMNGIKIPSQRI